MEVKVGMQQVAREVVVDTEQSAEQVQTAFEEALRTEGLFTLHDAKGSTVLVRADKVAYLDLGKESSRRVGFGSL